MPLDRQALEGFDEEKAHQEAAKHVDRQGRVRKVAPVDGLNEISHRIASPTAKSAPYCNCKVRLHSPEFLRRRQLAVKSAVAAARGAGGGAVQNFHGHDWNPFSWR